MTTIILLISAQLHIDIYLTRLGSEGTNALVVPVSEISEHNSWHPPLAAFQIF